MGRFVKGFVETKQHDLTNEINNYAKKNNLNIIQVSYACSSYMHTYEKAIVIFEGEEPQDY